MCNLVLTILNEHLSYFLSPLPSQMSQSFNKNPRLASFPKAAPKNNVSKRCTKTILRMNTPMSLGIFLPIISPRFSQRRPLTKLVSISIQPCANKTGALSEAAGLRKQMTVECILNTRFARRCTAYYRRG